MEQNGIDKKEYNKIVEKKLTEKLSKVVKHINLTTFAKAEIYDGKLKIVFVDDVIVSKDQKENILDLFVKGGILQKKSKDKEGKNDFFIIKPFTE